MNSFYNFIFISMQNFFVELTNPYLKFYGQKKAGQNGGHKGRHKAGHKAACHVCVAFYLT